MTLPWSNEEERDLFFERMMADTGFFCRSVLGMDTDRDASSGDALSEIGKGGVRAYGPHQEMVRFLDDQSITHGILMAPRFSYKSSVIQGLIMRMIVSRPNISILLLMHEQKMATQRCTQIRDSLLSNPILKELFPDMRGPVWQADQFVTGLRTDKSLQSPTLFVGSPQKLPTGARPDLILFDDIVSNINSRTPLGLQRGRECIEKCLALGSRGYRALDIGTPYHYGDAHHWCIDKPGWKRLIHLDVGYDLHVNDDKSMDLVGDARWENLPKKFLMKHLRGGMSFTEFMSQFKLRIVSGTHQPFQRTHFQPTNWKSEYGNLTGYLLTDIAPSDKQENALNVLMYVGIDHMNRVYILDLEIGHWLMLEFCERYLNMVARWSGKVTHRAELWEKMLSSEPYKAYLLVQAKKRNIKTHIVWQPRNQTSLSKDPRIHGLQVRFQGKEVYVVDTVPKTWNDGTEIRMLWDPESEVDIKTGARLPGGELVEQFVRFPHHPKKDIPDAMSLIDAMDKESGERVCYYIQPSRAFRPDLPKIDFSKDVAHAPRNKVGSAQRFYDRYARRASRSGGR